MTQALPLQLWHVTNVKRLDWKLLDSDAVMATSLENPLESVDIPVDCQSWTSLFRPWSGDVCFVLFLTRLITPHYHTTKGQLIYYNLIIIIITSHINRNSHGHKRNSQQSNHHLPANQNRPFQRKQHHGIILFQLLYNWNLNKHWHLKFYTNGQTLIWIYIFCKHHHGNTTFTDTPLRQELPSK